MHMHIGSYWSYQQTPDFQMVLNKPVGDVKVAVYELILTSPGERYLDLQLDVHMLVAHFICSWMLCSWCAVG